MHYLRTFFHRVLKLLNFFCVSYFQHNIHNTCVSTSAHPWRNDSQICCDHRFVATTTRSASSCACTENYSLTRLVCGKFIIEQKETKKRFRLFVEAVNVFPDLNAKIVEKLRKG